MVRRAMLAVVAGLGVCTSEACARGDQVILSPVAAGEYEQFQVGGIKMSAGVLPPVDAIGAQIIALTPPPSQQRYVDSGTLEFSLASLPAGAVVTSASLTYETTNVTPPLFSSASFYLSMHDGVDGQVTEGDFLKTPSLVVAIPTIPSAGVYTTNFNGLSYLNNRSAMLPSGYLGLNFDPVDFPGKVYIWINHPNVQLPELRIDYAVAPEPASVGMLGVGMLMLLRRRR